MNNLNSCYGTEEELKAVVESIKPAKAIADIVVNHRSGTTSWGDFTNPKWNDDYYSICSDDEGFSLSGSPMLGSSKTYNSTSLDITKTNCNFSNIPLDILLKLSSSSKFKSFNFSF